MGRSEQVIDEWQECRIMNFSQDWLCVSTDDIILLNKAGEYRFSHVSVCLSRFSNHKVT